MFDGSHRKYCPCDLKLQVYGVQSTTTTLPIYIYNMDIWRMVIWHLATWFHLRANSTVQTIRSERKRMRKDRLRNGFKTLTDKRSVDELRFQENQMSIGCERLLPMTSLIWFKIYLSIFMHI